MKHNDEIQDRKTILLVEDDVFIALAEKAVLERNGYAVLRAGNGEQALALVRENPKIDLVLMDIDLGPGAGMDGTEAAEIILSDRDLPLVFLSSHTEPEIVEKTEGISSYGYVVKNSGDTVLLASIRMAFRLFDSRMREKEQQAELFQSRQHLSSVVQTQRELISRSLPDTTLIFVNQAYCRLYGMREHEIIGTRFIDALPHEHRENVLHNLAALTPDKPYSTYTHSMVTHNEECVWVEWVDQAVFDAHGTVVEIQSVGRDVTERRSAEQAVRASESTYRLIFDTAPLGINRFDAEGRIAECNDNFVQIIGSSREMLIGLNMLHLPDQVLVTALRTALSGSPAEYEGLYTSVTANKVTPVRVLFAPFSTDEQTGIGGGMCIVENISERKQAQDELHHQLQEKTLLLREMQHRIKNNIATIAGMLSLQLQSISSKEAETALKAAIGRVGSMRELYEKMLLSDDAQQVSAGAYLGDLTDSVLEFFSGPTTVRLEKQFDEVVLEPSTLSSLGIVLNELLTNAMKHAFAGRGSGAIVVGLNSKGGQLCLWVEDNGCGLPAGFDPENGTSLGITLVRILAEQLNGSFEMSTGTGDAAQSGTRSALVIEH